MKIAQTILLLFIATLMVNAQPNENEYKLIRKFSDAFSLLVSDDEKMIALITDNNKLEIYELKPLKFIKRVKVTRNTWLNKAFFNSENEKLFFDYGTQFKFKYRCLNIKTGKVKKVKCEEVPRGCSFQAIKICDDDNKILPISNGEFYFEVKGIEILLFEKK